MNNSVGIRLIFVLVIIFGSTMLLSSKRTSKEQNDSWRLIWMESFNTQTLDTNIWKYMARGRDDSRKYHSSNPKCYEIKNSKLIIKGIKNSDQKSDTARYLTGGITTEGKKAFSPGRIEIKAKLESAKGAWPAFWLLPFKKENGWPADGEIDIMEHLNYDKFVYQTVHSSYTKSNHNSIPLRSVKAEIKPNKFNIYRVDILAEEVNFYVNGKMTLSYPKVDSLLSKGEFPYYREWFLMLDMQLGGSWVGTLDSEDLPINMEIDWIKYYQQR